MALSGFNKNNIEVEMADGELTVRSKNLDDSRFEMITNIPKKVTANPSSSLDICKRSNINGVYII